MNRTIDNQGIGAIYASFTVAKTGDAYDLVPEDVGKAVTLSGNNEISLGSDGDVLLGRLEYVMGGLATVQIGGVARFSYNTSKTAPSVSNRVVADGAGKVYPSPPNTSVPPGGVVGRGHVTLVDAASHHCDVLL